MSWVKENKLKWFETLAVNILKCGAIPNHLAFIMDGNRRFASRLGVLQIEGHTKGFDKLTDTLRWCLDLGIREVTVYAFSIENFKRSEEEVERLMTLAREKFNLLLKEKEKLKEHGIRIRIIGNIRLLPTDLQKLVVEATESTRLNNKAVLNVAFSYTSREEMSHAVSELAWGLRENYLKEDDIDEKLIEKCLYTGDSTPPDLLIRTSGEVRLSDFLLWQTSYSTIYFTPVLWPEFSLWDLCKAILHYQKNVPSVKEALISENLKLGPCNEETPNRINNFMEELDKKESQFRNNLLLL